MDIDKKIMEIDLKINKEKRKADSLRSKQSRQQRKDRTRRLIEKGALLEKYFKAKNLSVEETELMLKRYANFVNQKESELRK